MASSSTATHAKPAANVDEQSAVQTTACDPSHGELTAQISPATPNRTPPIYGQLNEQYASQGVESLLSSINGLGEFPPERIIDGAGSVDYRFYSGVRLVCSESQARDEGILTLDNNQSRRPHPLQDCAKLFKFLWRDSSPLTTQIPGEKRRLWPILVPETRSFFSLYDFAESTRREPETQQTIDGKVFMMTKKQHAGHKAGQAGWLIRDETANHIWVLFLQDNIICPRDLQVLLLAFRSHHAELFHKLRDLADWKEHWDLPLPFRRFLSMFLEPWRPVSARTARPIGTESALSIWTWQFHFRFFFWNKEANTSRRPPDWYMKACRERLRLEPATKGSWAVYLEEKRMSVAAYVHINGHFKVVVLCDVPPDGRTHLYEDRHPPALMSPSLGRLGMDISDDFHQWGGGIYISALCDIVDTWKDAWWSTLDGIDHVLEIKLEDISQPGTIEEVMFDASFKTSKICFQLLQTLRIFKNYVTECQNIFEAATVGSLTSLVERNREGHGEQRPSESAIKEALKIVSQW